MYSRQPKIETKPGSKATTFWINLHLQESTMKLLFRLKKHFRAPKVKKCGQSRQIGPRLREELPLQINQKELLRLSKTFWSKINLLWAWIARMIWAESRAAKVSLDIQLILHKPWMLIFRIELRGDIALKIFLNGYSPDRFQSRAPLKMTKWVVKERLIKQGMRNSSPKRTYLKEVAFSLQLPPKMCSYVIVKIGKGRDQRSNSWPLLTPNLSILALMQSTLIKILLQISWIRRSTCFHLWQIQATIS